MAGIEKINHNVQARALPTNGFTVQLNKVDNPYIAQTGFENVNGVITKLALQAKEKADQVAIIELQRKLDVWESDRLLDPRKGAFTRKGEDAFSLPEDVMQDYDTYTSDLLEKLQGDEQKLAAQKLINSRRASSNEQIQKYVFGEIQSHGVKTVNAGIESAMNRASLYFNDPQKNEEAIRQAVDTYKAFAIKNGENAEVIALEAEKYESQGVYRTLGQIADYDPTRAEEYYEANKFRLKGEHATEAAKLIIPVQRRQEAQQVVRNVVSNNTPKTNSYDIIKYVIDDLEGTGNNVVRDGKGWAKYGINSVANPDIDLNALTEDGAIEITKQRYWDKHGIDQLPVEMQAIAFDMYFNGWDPKVLGMTVKEAVSKSGGDPRQLISMRRQYFDRLGQINPEQHGPNVKGWHNRLNKMEKQLDLLRGRVPDDYEVLREIDETVSNPAVADEAKKQAKQTLEAMRAAKKASYDAASEEAWDYIDKGMQVPPSVEARMNPKDAVDMRKGYEPDALLYEETRQRILAGDDVDLGELRWKLGNKFGELLRLQNNPDELSNARTVDDVLEGAMARVIGTQNAKSAATLQKKEAFRRRWQEEISLRQRNGEKVTSKEAQSIADRLLMKVKKEGKFFSSDSSLFELGEDDKYRVNTIPKDRQYLFNGKVIQYDDMIDKLSDTLEARGQTIDPESLEKMLNKLIERKVIGVQYENR